MGLIQATEGTAEIFGKDVQKYKKEILADIGYLPSETMFYNGMRVKELSELPITDITIAEPDLEEVFMHYYSKEESGYGHL